MDATLGSFALFVLISVALLFDALNGLHDAANSIATVVSTRVLRPHYAVAWAAFFNFIAFLFFGVHVAQTVGTGIVAAEVVDAAVIFGALMGAIVWNLITWWLGIPSSSSHALIGGLAGAGIAKAGLGAIVWNGLGITAAAIVLSPLLGFFLALLLMLAVAWAFLDAVCRGQFLSLGPAALGGALLARARGQRCAEDHGHHCGATLFPGAPRRDFLHTILGRDLPGSDGPWDAGRRLAHRAHLGLADYPLASRTGLHVLNASTERDSSNCGLGKEFVELIEGGAEGPVITESVTSGLFGFAKTANRVASGSNSCKSPTCFAASSPCM